MRVIVGPHIGFPFGYLLRLAWEQSDMTQREFARRLGVQQPRVVEIFRQESMTERLLDRCLVALGVTLEVRILKG